jgi:ParB/RepB/Spo0J family partition protein
MSEPKEIRVDNIRPDPDQPRRHIDEDYIEELASSIGEIGLRTRIEVIELDGECEVDYEINHGECRWRAHKNLGKQTIKSEVVDEDDENRHLGQLHENIHRNDITSIEKGKGALKEMEKAGVEGKPDEIAKRIISLKRSEDRGNDVEANSTEVEKSILTVCDLIGKSKRSVANWLKAASLPDTVTEQEMEENNLAGSVMTRLAGVDDKDKQIEIYEELVERDMNASDSKKLITQMKGGDVESVSTGVSDGEDVETDSTSADETESVETDSTNDSDGENVETDSTLVECPCCEGDGFVPASEVDE